MLKSTCIFSSIIFLFIRGSLFAQTNTANIVITKVDIEKAGTSIEASAIGEPVSSVKLYAPRWIDATTTTPAHAIVEGSIMPVDPNGWPINFRVLLPAVWSLRERETTASLPLS